MSVIHSDKWRQRYMSPSVPVSRTLNATRARTSRARLQSRQQVVAFETYPWTRWSIPEDNNQKRLERLQYLYLGHALMHGLVLIDQQLRSVSAFLPPGAPEPASDGQNEVLELLGCRVSALADPTLPQPLAPAWNLATVGVDQPIRAQG
jgi:hypothetical protein